MTLVEPERSSHGDYVPDAGEFATSRAGWRTDLSLDGPLRAQAVALQVAAEERHYTYTWEWGGVPIIRLPDDVMVLQELFWTYRPERVVETGVARGGSMLLDAALMRLAGVEPRVLGIDHKIFSHTLTALTDHPQAVGVELLEADSAGPEAVAAVREFVAGAERTVLILDSNHTHEHVFNELERLAVLLPAGSFVLVADTLIEELPAEQFANRPWGHGDNPLTAANAFLARHPGFVRSEAWARRALVTEFRDGILQRVGR